MTLGGWSPPHRTTFELNPALTGRRFPRARVTRKRQILNHAELFAAGATAEAAITLDGALRPLRNGRRAALHTPHPSLSLPEATYTAAQPQSTRQAGANADRTQRNANH